MPRSCTSRTHRSPGATYLRVLPETMRVAIVRGLAGADVLGFQAKLWAENYLLSARSLPEVRVLRGGRLQRTTEPPPCERSRWR